MIKIIIDDRERACGIIDILKTYLELDIVIARLTIGDYLINDKIFIERKTLLDFARSIIDNRLFKQVSFLARSQYRCALILEGTQATIEDLGVSREAMQGALITVSLVYGIAILRSRNIAETARLINYIAQQFDEIAQGSLLRKDRKPKSRVKLQLHILQGLPHVGIERTQQLLQIFGSVEKVIIANTNELQKISGIGKIIAQKIRAAVSLDLQKADKDIKL